MTTPKARRSRRAQHPAELVLTVAVALAVVIALAGFGGVLRPVRLALHLVLGAGLVACLLLPQNAVRTGGVAVRLAGASGLLVGAAAAGLLPIPRPLRPWIAPGWEARGPDHHTATLDPAATLSAVADLLLFAGILFAVACWSGRRRARRAGWFGVVGLGLSLVVVAAAYVATGTRSWFGVEVRGNMPFFAPFVNPNHYGAGLLLTFPFVAGRTLSPHRGAVPRWLAALIALGMVGMALWAGSSGPVLIMGIQLLLLFRRRGRIPWWGFFCLLLVGFAGMVVFDAYRSSGDRMSLHGRLPIWWASLRMWAEHPLLGVGAGSYAVALPPYRTDHSFESWRHAHNDWLEWAVETGLVGVVALMVAMWGFWPRLRRRGEGSVFAIVALVGIALHATLDFPFHIPGLLVATGALLAWRAAVYDHRKRVSVVLYRGVAAVLLAGQLGAAGWQTRSWIVERAEAQLDAAPRGSAAHREAMATLTRWAPRSWRLGIERAIQLAREGHVDEGSALARTVADRHRYDADVQSTVAQYFLAVGRPEEALVFAERAVDRGPSDWRNWKVRAEVWEQARPERAYEAWRDALLAGTPHALTACWRVLPVGIYWVDAVEDRGDAMQIAVAKFLAERDPEAALVAFDMVHRNDHDRFEILHAKLLARFAPERALAYVARAVEQDPDRAAFRSLYAELLEQAGRWDEAAVVWRQFDADDRKYFDRFIRATLEAQGPEAVLLELERAEAAGRLLSPDTLLLKAELHAGRGQVRACVATLKRSKLLEHRRTRGRARKLLERCGKTSPP